MYDAVRAYDADNAGLVLLKIEPVTYDDVVVVPDNEPVIPELAINEPVIIIEPVTIKDPVMVG
jgi:hypothetical protein